ncbi:RNA-dependent RNA polymerase [Bluegill toti-like virus 1]|nr:RNA-dependent RNA polymerase [Bluegill toti-like virus 1]
MGELTEREDVWRELHPTDLDIDKEFEKIRGLECKNECDIFESYEPNKHRELDKGLWQGEWGGLPYPLCVCVDFYLGYQSAEVRELIVDCIVKSGLNVPVCIHTWLMRTKELSDWVKRRGPLIGEHWRALVDLSSLVGFNLNEVPLEEQDKIIRDWCEGVVIRDQMTTLGICNQIKKEMAAPSPNRSDCLTLREYTDRPDVWVTKGSGKGVRVRLEDTDTGREVWSASNKAAVALSLSVDEIVARLLSDKSEIFSVSGKVEVAGKGRLIISPGWEFNMLLSYIMYHYEPCIRRTRSDSPLWTTKNGTRDMWYTIARETTKGRWMYPQDVSKFDQTVATDELNTIFIVLKEWIERVGVQSVKSDLRAVWRAVWKRWLSARVRLPGSGKTIRWQHGMPSGIRLTAIGDTLISLARAHAVFKFNNLHTTMCLGMGDDILVAAVNKNYILPLFEETNKMGVMVNAAKNFASTKHAEFLRIAFDDKSASGYPARHVVKHLFIEPGAARVRLWHLEDMKAYIASNVLFLARGCEPSRVWQIVEGVVRDVMGQDGVDWMHTPRTLGGEGVRPLSPRGVTMTQNQKQGRYEVKKTGSFKTVAENTMKQGVERTAVEKDLAGRVVRGLPLGGMEPVTVREVGRPEVLTPLVSKLQAAIEGTGTKSGIPAYRMDEKKVGVVLQDLVVEQWIADGKWDEFVANAAPEVRSYARWINDHWERRATAMWLRAKMPSGVPRVDGWSEQAVADVAARGRSAVDGWLMSMHRVGKGDILRGYVTLECVVFDYCVKRKYVMAY